MTYLPVDPEPVSIAHFIAGFLPQVADMAASMGCDRAFAARVVAIKFYRAGWRTTSVGDMRFTHHETKPIGPVDDDPGPGSRADIAA